MSPVENEAVVCEILRAAPCLVPSVELNLLIHVETQVTVYGGFQACPQEQTQIGKDQLMGFGMSFCTLATVGTEPGEALVGVREELALRTAPGLEQWKAQHVCNNMQ